MSDESENTNPYKNIDREKYLEAKAERDSHKEVMDKEFIPNFFPTYRINRKFYPLPIIFVVLCAGLLAFLTFYVAQIPFQEGGYVSEKQHGPWAGIINGIIFTAIAAFWSFVIIYLVKKKGIEVLKYIFGASFGFLSFFLTFLFGTIILYVIFINLPYTDIIELIYIISYYSLLIGSGIFTAILIYKYFTSESFTTKNFIVIYIGLMIGAILGIIMPLWTTLAILIGLSLWDIFAVKSKRGPIKEMIDIASHSDEEMLTDEEIKEKIESGEIIYDTAKLEIGIGDLAFYSMLTTSALLQTGNVIVMILTAIAIIVGTGITISGLARNKILPGLPISIFLGIGTMLISWWIFILLDF